MNGHNERQNYAAAATRLHRARMLFIERLETASFLDAAARERLRASLRSGGVYDPDPTDTPVIQNIKLTMNRLVEMESLLRTVVDPVLESRGTFAVISGLWFNRAAILNLGNTYAVLCHYTGELTDLFSLIASSDTELASEMSVLNETLLGQVMPVMDVLKTIWQGVPAAEQPIIVGETAFQQDASPPLASKKQPGKLAEIRETLATLLQQSRAEDPQSEKSRLLGQAGIAAEHLDGVLGDFVDFLWNGDNWNKEGMLKGKPKLSGIRKLYSSIEHLGDLIKILEEIDVPALTEAHADETMRLMLIEMAPMIGKAAGMLDAMEGRLGLREHALQEQLLGVIERYNAACLKMNVHLEVPAVSISDVRRDELLHAKSVLNELRNNQRKLLDVVINSDTTLQQMMELKANAMLIGGPSAAYFIRQLDLVIFERTGSARLDADIFYHEGMIRNLSRTGSASSTNIEMIDDHISTLRELYHIRDVIKQSMIHAASGTDEGEFSYKTGEGLCDVLQDFVQSAALQDTLTALQNSSRDEVLSAESTVDRMRVRLIEAEARLQVQPSAANRYFAERDEIQAIDEQIDARQRKIALMDSWDESQNRRVANISVKLNNSDLDLSESEIRVLARIKAGYTTGNSDVVQAANSEVENIRAVYEDWKERHQEWKNSWGSYIRSAPPCSLLSMLADAKMDNETKALYKREIENLTERKNRIRADVATHFSAHPIDDVSLDDLLALPIVVAARNDGLVQPVSSSVDVMSESAEAALSDEALIDKLKRERIGEKTILAHEMQLQLIKSAKEYLDAELIIKLRRDRGADGVYQMDSTDPILLRNLKSSMNALHQIEVTLAYVQPILYSVQSIKHGGSVNMIFEGVLAISELDDLRHELSRLQRSLQTFGYELGELTEASSAMLPPAWLDTVRGKFSDISSACENAFGVLQEVLPDEAAESVPDILQQVQSIAAPMVPKSSEGWLYASLKNHAIGTMQKGYPLNIMDLADQLERNYDSAANPDAPPIQHLVDALRSISLLSNGAVLYVEDEVLAGNLNMGVGFVELMKVYGNILLAIQPQVVQLAARAEWVPELYGLKFSEQDKEKLHSALRSYDSWNVWMHPKAEKYPWDTQMIAAIHYDAERDLAASADVLARGARFRNMLISSELNNIAQWEMNDLVGLREYSKHLDAVKSADLLADVEKVILKRTHLDDLELQIKEVKRSITSVQNDLCQMEDGVNVDALQREKLLAQESIHQALLSHCLDMHETALEKIASGVEILYSSGQLLNVWHPSTVVTIEGNHVDSFLSAIADKMDQADRRQYLMEKAACHVKFEAFIRHHDNINAAIDVINMKKAHLYKATDTLLDNALDGCNVYLKDAGGLHLFEQLILDLSYEKLSLMTATEIADARNDFITVQDKLSETTPPLSKENWKAMDDLLARAVIDNKVSFARHEWVVASTQALRGVVKSAEQLELAHPELERMKLKIPEKKNSSSTEYTYYLIKMLVSVSNEKYIKNKYSGLVNQGLMTVAAATARLKGLKQEVTPASIEQVRRADHQEKLDLIKGAATAYDSRLFRYFRKVFHRSTMEDQIYYLINANAPGHSYDAARQLQKSVLTASKQGFFPPAANDPVMNDNVPNKTPNEEEAPVARNNNSNNP